MLILIEIFDSFDILLNNIMSRVCLVNKKNALFVGGSEECSGLMADISDKVETDKADPSCWIFAVKLLGD